MASGLGLVSWKARFSSDSWSGQAIMPITLIFLFRNETGLDVVITINAGELNPPDLVSATLNMICVFLGNRDP